MIGVVVRDMPYLKLLYPICEQFHLRGEPYVLYHWDYPRGEKEYLRANLSNLRISSPKAIKWANKIRPFSTDKQLYDSFKQDGITKIVSVELGLWLNKKAVSAKTYSIQYLTDSLWKNSTAGLTKVYYGSRFLMDTHHDFHGLKLDPNRDRFVGSPIFDPLANEISSGKDILILLPNLRAEHVKMSFGCGSRFVEMIRNIANSGNLIFKTRKKQWLPNEIKPFAKEILDDGDIMYPPRVSDLFTRCNTTVMFYSSGLYEAVYAGNYVINIPIPLKRWSWDQGKLRNYFESALYNFDGVVETVSQQSVVDGSWQLTTRTPDVTRRHKWIEQYIGLCPTCPNDGAKNVVDDILRK